MTRKSTSATPPLLITCEHGGNDVPAPYRQLFRDAGTILASHRGFDAGALTMAEALAAHFSAPLLSASVSRLLVDLNRSLGHRHLHMDSIRALPEATRQEIIEHYYQPYRAEAERLVTEAIASQGSIIHLSCHSFTNLFNGVERQVDIGLLYDPARAGEKALCAHWKSALKASAPGLQVRRNFPYQGRNDGLTTTLRKKFPADAYLGIELELNQKNITSPARQWRALRALVIDSLDNVLRRYQP